jgi:uncharacterized protein YndB with AHSA1/START domain
MPVDVGSLIIARPVEEVFTYLSNFSNLPYWNSAIIQSNYKWAAPEVLGSTFVATFKFLDKQINTTCIVVEYEPNRQLSWRSISSPMDFFIRLSFEPFFEDTKLSYTVERKLLQGLFAQPSPALLNVAKSQFEIGLESLKILLESENRKLASSQTTLSNNYP